MDLWGRWTSLRPLRGGLNTSVPTAVRGPAAKTAPVSKRVCASTGAGGATASRVEDRRFASTSANGAVANYATVQASASTSASGPCAKTVADLASAHTISIEPTARNARLPRALARVSACTRGSGGSAWSARRTMSVSTSACALTARSAGLQSWSGRNNASMG